jgi:uncharacterized protein YfaS (alpha-2-macroglobulin family)
MHFLTEAKTKGYSVPNDIFSAGMGYLKDLARREISTLEQARIQAYAIYLLSRNEIVTSNYLTQLQLTLNKMKDSKWQQDITSTYLAATYQLLKSYNEAEKMIGYYSPKNQVDMPTDFYNLQIANAQYLYLLGHHFPDRLGKAQIPLVLALVDELNNNTMNTVLAGYTSLALAAYNQFSSFPSHATLSINQILNNNKPTILTSTNGLYQKINASFAAKQIVFNNPSNQMYFYQLTQAGFDTILPKEVSHQGIEVYREFLTDDGRPISSIHLGDELTVHIRARTIDNRYHDNVAVLDLLPGGFEVIRHSINLQNMDYVDIREDRVLFFGNLNFDSKEITYRIKAINTGKFTVPGILAMDMYNPLVKSLGIAGRIEVEK